MSRTSAYRIVLGLGAVVITACSALAADNYTLDGAHSSVSFKARHFDISWIHGRFNDVKGSYSLDREDGTRSTFEMTIDAGSVDTGNKGRDDHLRKPDFFDINQYPKITFKSTSVKPVKDGYEVTGDFTMHGKTQKISFVVHGGKEIEAQGTKRTGFSTELKLKRSDYGFDKKNIGPIGDEVLVSIDFEGTRK